MKALCIAHRGKHDKYFENTKEAFIEASKGEYYGIETDIHLTKDNVWIIHHNDDIISKGQSYKICDLTSDEIFSMDLDNDQGHEHARVCLFSDYLEICKNSGKRPIIEIKNKPNPGYLRKLVAYIDMFMGIENVTFIGFYPKPLFVIKKACKGKADIQHLICEQHTKIVLLIAKFANFGVDILYSLATKKMVEKLHKHNRKINVWTINDDESLNISEDLGVDFVTTDVFNQNS